MTALVDALDRIPAGGRIIAGAYCGGPTSLLRGVAERSSGRGWQLCTGLLLDDGGAYEAAGTGDLRLVTWHVTGAGRELAERGLLDYLPVQSVSARKADRDMGSRCRADPRHTTGLRWLVQPRTVGRLCAHRNQDREAVHRRSRRRAAPHLRPIPRARLGAGRPGALDDPNPDVSLAGTRRRQPGNRPACAHPVTGPPGAADRHRRRDRGDRLGARRRGRRPVTVRGHGHRRHGRPLRARPARWRAAGDPVTRSPWDTTADALRPREPGGWCPPIQRGALAAVARRAPAAGVGEQRRGDRSSRAGEQRSRGRSSDRRHRWINRLRRGRDPVDRRPAGHCPAVDDPRWTRSRIVPRLDANATVTIPRGMVDAVVTEHGIAQLEGKTLRQRAEALIDVAAPQHRQALGDALRHPVAI